MPFFRSSASEDFTIIERELTAGRFEVFSIGMSPAKPEADDVPKVDDVWMKIGGFTNPYTNEVVKKEEAATLIWNIAEK